VHLNRLLNYVCEISVKLQLVLLAFNCVKDYFKLAKSRTISEMAFKVNRYASSYDHIETHVLYFVKNDVKIPLHTLKSYASQKTKANALVFLSNPCLLSNIFKCVFICIIKPYICVKINFHSSCIKYIYRSRFHHDKVL